jgi:DNA-directed RNA polymerase specialized sigma24 family protein
VQGATIDSEARRDEIELVARARAADPRAFRALYDLAFRVVFAWSLRATGHPAGAERLTAAILRRAFSELAGFDGSRSLGGWLIGHAQAALEADAPVAGRGAVAREVS